MPDWISSQMSRMPCSSQRARSSRRNEAGAGLKPPSPWIGSMMMAATDEAGISWPRRVRSAPIAPAVAGFLVVAEVAVHVGKRRQVDRRQKGLVAEPVVDARARDRGGAERSAVEGAPEGDDAGPPGHPAGELERRPRRPPPRSCRRRRCRAGPGMRRRASRPAGRPAPGSRGRCRCGATCRPGP